MKNSLLYVLTVIAGFMGFLVAGRSLTEGLLAGILLAIVLKD